MHSKCIQVARLQDRVDGLTHSLGNLRRECDARTAEHEELTREYQQLQGKHRENVDAEHKLLTENESLKTRLDFALRDVESAQQENTSLTKQQSHLSKRAQDSFGKALSESKELQEQMQRLLQLQNQDAKAIITTLKADKTKYKKMCVKLSAKVSALQHDLAQQKKDAALAVQGKDLEKQNATRQLREV
jgi:chromosome segregation ATPase